jgi:hypothetical protein
MLSIKLASPLSYGLIPKYGHHQQVVRSFFNLRIFIAPPPWEIPIVLSMDIFYEIQSIQGILF